MFQGLFHGNPPSGINFNQLPEQIKSIGIKVLEMVIKINFLQYRWLYLELGESGFEVGETVDPRPGLFGRRAVQLEDLENLVDFRVPHEKRFLFNHLVENAAHRPGVYTQSILFLT